MKEKETGNTKIIVRGYSHCPYHADILDEVKTQYKGLFGFTCPGGGRIEHDANAKTIFIYGFSQVRLLCLFGLFCF